MTCDFTAKRNYFATKQFRVYHRETAFNFHMNNFGVIIGKNKKTLTAILQYYKMRLFITFENLIPN